MGKGYGITTILAILAVFRLTTAASAAYYSVGLGGGGSADEQNLTLEIGHRDVKIGPAHFLLGLALPFIDHGDDNVPEGTIDSPCPHSDYRSLGEKTEGMEAGLLGKIGINRLHPDFYVSLLGGITRVHEVHLAQSTRSDQYYEQSSKKRWNGVYGISFGYFPEVFSWKTKLNVQIDIDNRRGVTGSIGWGW